MATNSNTGHTNNLNSFYTLITVCKEIGIRYKPSNEELAVVSMEGVHAGGIKAIEDVQRADIANSDAINIRIALFGDLDAYSSRVVNFFALSGADSKSIDNVRSIHRKMRSQPSTKVAVPAGDTEGVAVKTRSTAQLGYDDKASNFSQIASIVEANPTYKVNEEDVSKEAIRAFSSKLQVSNETCIETERALETARIERDRILYKGEKSMHRIFMDVKTYIKAAFGTSSVEFKRVSGIQFKNMAR